VVTRVCLSVCVSVHGACLHYCTDPDITWWNGRRCPIVVHYWVDLQSVHRLRCYDNTMGMRSRAQRESARPTARSTPHELRMPAKSPLAGDKIDAHATCAVPFRPYCGGVAIRTRNVSEYVLVLALCLVCYLT